MTVELQCKPSVNGRVVVDAVMDGRVVHSSELDLTRSEAVDQFYAAVIGKYPHIDRCQLDQQVMQIVAGPTAPVERAMDSNNGFRVGDRDNQTGKLILSPSDPLPSARAFLREQFMAENIMVMRYYAGVFFVWRGNRYTPLADDTLRSILYQFTENTVRHKTMPEGEIRFVPYQPTQSKIGNLIDAIKAESHLAADTVPPDWLIDDSTLPLPRELLPCKSGTLHIPTRQWIKPTPTLFTTSALSFDYDANAPTPETWIKFLNQLWPDDPQSIDALQEWFGYCLTGDTTQQKMLLLVGPKRSGKGTIGRVLTALVGAANVAGPTTSSLATQFGLQPLIGKALAIVSDARFSGQPESTIVLERLLCISGEDTLTIPRKYLGDVTMKLPTRFMFLTNELPRVADTSGALAGRFIPLILRLSFFGHEDTELTDKLLAELPGILLWALKGWERLRARGRFQQPDSSRDAVQELADLSSPVAAFIRDHCLIGPGFQADGKALYETWRMWCEDHGRDHPGTIQTFGRDLLTAAPGLRRARPRDGDERRRGYVGIGLRADSGPGGPQWSATQPIEAPVSESPSFDPMTGNKAEDTTSRYADHRGPDREQLLWFADRCENPAMAAEYRRQAAEL